MLDAMVAVTVGSGTLVVAASGNSRQRGSPPEYPASLPHVLTIGALDQGNAPAFFSSGSQHVDLSAPGVNIPVAIPLTYHPPSYYDLYFSGTSFASPLVAGAAAWVWTARPTLDLSQLFEVMRGSAQDVSSPGYDAFSGFGRLDIPGALTVAPPPRDPQEPNEDVSYVKANGLLHRAATPLTSARPEERCCHREPRPRRGPAGRLQGLDPGAAGRLDRASALRRRRRPRSLGAAHEKRPRGRQCSETRLPRALGAHGDEAGATARQEHGEEGFVLLRRGVRRRGRRKRRPQGRRAALHALGLDRQPRSAVAAA